MARRRSRFAPRRVSKTARVRILAKGPPRTTTTQQTYRNDDGYVLSGPEYPTVFSGLTGAELDTVDFETARGSVSAWGDSYGNRVDRFLASVGFVSDGDGSGAGSGRPALLMARVTTPGQPSMPTRSATASCHTFGPGTAASRVAPLWKDKARTA